MTFRSRKELVKELDKGPFDIVVIGGGATGLGAALDAATRGYRVALFEQSDYTKGTSSRSTKLIHGGVRYLRSGQVRLVREGLKERGLLLKNAPHIVHPLNFFVPANTFFERMYAGLGLKLYDLLSGSQRIGWSKPVAPVVARRLLPNLQAGKTAGGIVYSDGQFDDARLGVATALTAIEHGAVSLNYFKVENLLHSDGKVTGVEVRDLVTSQNYKVESKSVINATGVFSDSIAALSKDKQDYTIVPSQGAHIVLPRRFFEGDTGLLVPETSDGRVLFVIPWMDHTLVGTTDTALEEPSLEPRPLSNEIDFILETLSEYLVEIPTREDILAVFAGLRPLIKEEGVSSKDMSREHKIIVGESGLININGGKWTAYRKMGEDVVDHAIKQGELTSTSSVSSGVKIHGYPAGKKYRYAEYGADSILIEDLIDQNPKLGDLIHPSFNYTLAHVVYAVRFEHALTVEDILARRTRMLFLNAQAAIDSADKVAGILKDELDKDSEWAMKQLEDFISTAEGYKI